MEYIKLVKELEQQSISKLPALFIVISELCIKNKVFMEGGMEKVLNRIKENQ